MFLVPSHIARLDPTSLNNTQLLHFMTFLESHGWQARNHISPPLMAKLTNHPQVRFPTEEQVSPTSLKTNSFTQQPTLSLQNDYSLHRSPRRSVPRAYEPLRPLRRSAERLRTAPRNAGGHDVRQLLELFDEALEELLRTEAPSTRRKHAVDGRTTRAETDRPD